MKKKDLSQEDKKTWEEYIKNPSDIYDKDQGTSYGIQRRERYKFDLHGFTLAEANKKISSLIKANLFKIIDVVSYYERLSEEEFQIIDKPKLFNEIKIANYIIDKSLGKTVSLL